MQIRYAVNKEQYQRMTTEELRKHFLVERVFVLGALELVYWETDRTVLGGVVPTDSPIALETDPLLASDFFCERRELGAFNLGGSAEISVDGQTFPLAFQDFLYVGRGSRNITFASVDKENPARLFLISYPAHQHYPVTLASHATANRLELGAPATANQRSLCQYVHQNGVPSCQLVTGITALKPGSVWNTMPPHTHTRRSEVYFYFQVPETAAIVHLMGPPEETRHLMVHNEQAILSPIWSIHSGCGTENYSFIWAMGGENQRFSDMDAVKSSDIK
jgi:4-deoxy-L-threo-5-hexosulose-uronate ketol-isomerase